ncbi:MAG: hypothetical protein ACOVKC_08795 [Brevundimonas sp.]
MKLVRPVTILDAVLITSDVPEVNALTIYAGGTTYALNDTVYTLTGRSQIDQYVSKVGSNTGNTPPVVGAPETAFWRLTGSTYLAWNAATAYQVDDIVIVVSANSHLSYRRRVAGTTATAPSADATNWLALGATNRWKMFDGSITSQTSNPLAITETFIPAARVDTVACLNVVAGSITVTQTDPIDGLVFNVTTSMIDSVGIDNPWSYCFEPITYLSDLILGGLLPYANATIAVTINQPSGTALCGGLILGLSKDIGSTEYGASVGIQDYSVKAVDVFGNTSITQRAFSKRGDFTVWVPNTLTDILQTTLAGFRATPILYIGSDNFASTAIYGFFKDFTLAIAYPNVSIFTVSIEGLT